MWKSNSLGVTARIRALQVVRDSQQCTIHQSCVASTPAKPTTPGSLKDQPTKDPPRRRRRNDGLYKGLFGVALVGVGGAVGYAWYDLTFRDKVKANVPYSKEVMEAVFEYLPDSPSVPAPFMSGDTYPKLSKEGEQALLPKLKEVPVTLETSAPKSKLPPIKPKVAPTEAKVTPPEPNVTPPEPKVTPPPPPVVEEKSAAEQSKEDKAQKKQEAIDRKLREQEEARRRQAAKEAEVAAENATLEVILEHTWEACDVTVQKAIQVQQAVIEATKQHTSLLKTAMDDTSDILDKETQWQSVSMAFDKREDARSSAEQIVSNAKENLEKLRLAIDDGRANTVTKKNKALTAAKEKLNRLSTELNKHTNEVTKVESESRVMSKYKALIDTGKEQFKKEIESLMPDVKIGSGKKLSEDELNALIAHAHKRIEQLQKQLAEQLAMEQQRIQVALSDQRDEDELITQARVKQEQEKMKDQFAVEKDRWEADAQVQFEIELRHQLARVTAAHSEHLQEVLQVQERKLKEEFERERDMLLIEDRERFNIEMSGWVARLRGIEAAVEARAESEMVAREAQELWLACVALNGAIRVGNESGHTWEEQLKPLNDELDSVFFAAKNNPFVCLVLDSIPEKAAKRGVYTEENLKEKFDKVNKVARKVGMIDDTGGSLMKYFFSFLQSKFILSVHAVDKTSETVDLEQLDAYQICDHAQYWMERNNIEQALKFMNLLTGEPRRVASDWIDEARLLLETRQATYSLMAFASSTGLGTIF